jgi:hypothetical protein
MPPKIFTKMALTFGCCERISNPILTWSVDAPPPTSKKLAGFPPFNYIISIVDIASPAPLTIHPILPSSAI